MLNSNNASNATSSSNVSMLSLLQGIPNTDTSSSTTVNNINVGNNTNNNNIIGNKQQTPQKTTQQPEGFIGNFHKDEFQFLSKRQKEPLPIFLSSYPDINTTINNNNDSSRFGYCAHFHTLCPFTGRTICYCNKIFHSNRQKQQFIQNTKTILEMYTSKRPEYAKELNLTLDEHNIPAPTLNHSVIFSRDRLDFIKTNYQQIIKDFKKQEELLKEEKKNVVGTSHLVESYVKKKQLEKEDTATEMLAHMADVINEDNLVDQITSEDIDLFLPLDAATGTDDDDFLSSSSKLFTENELSQIPKKKGRPRTRKLCKVCDSSENESALIQCLSCGTYVHTFCHDPNLDHLDNTARLNWLCRDCKLCFSCKKLVTNDTSFVVCDCCDNAYHLDCLSESTRKDAEENDVWFCESCLTNQSKEKLEEVKEKASNLKKRKKKTNNNNNSNTKRKKKK
ncbi:hypothetical protein ABK040_010378 [Willaertia magna]